MDASAPILSFNADGLLPQDYQLTLEQLHHSVLVHGPGPQAPAWDAAWRATLVDNLRILVDQLFTVGIEEIFIDGSFTEDKDHPADIDGYFVCKPQGLPRLERELNALDPHKVWTWSRNARRPYKGKMKLPMWHRYRVELFPHYGQPSGIRDEFGNELEFPAAFRRTRVDRKPRGIIQIVRGRP